MAHVIVIGTGFGDRSVAPAYRARGCSVEVVSPRDEATVRKAIEAPCDLVSVHSPPFMHLDHVRWAAEAGRPVLCDKPFGRDAVEAQEMVALAARSGVLNFLNFEFRHDPARVKAKAIIDSGAVGAPVHVNSSAFISFARNQSHRWIFEQGRGGWIGAFGSHFVDMLRWMFGEIDAADGQTRIEVTHRRERGGGEAMIPSTAEDAFTAWFRTRSGVTAVLDTAFSASVMLPSPITILCSEAAVQIVDTSQVLVLRQGREAERHAFVNASGDQHQPALGLWLGEVLAAVADKRQIEPDFAAGLACARVLDKLRAA